MVRSYDSIKPMLVIPLLWLRGARGVRASRLTLVMSFIACGSCGTAGRVEGERAKAESELRTLLGTDTTRPAVEKAATSMGFDCVAFDSRVDPARGMGAAAAPGAILTCSRRIATNQFLEGIASLIVEARYTDGDLEELRVYPFCLDECFWLR